jgi:hypothetical protein
MKSQVAGKVAAPADVEMIPTARPVLVDVSQPAGIEVLGPTAVSGPVEPLVVVV